MFLLPTATHASSLARRRPKRLPHDTWRAVALPGRNRLGGLTAAAVFVCYPRRLPRRLPRPHRRAAAVEQVWMLVVGGLSLWGVSVQKKEHESLYDRRLRKRTRTRRASKPNRSPHAPLLDDHPGGGGVSPSASSSSSSSSSTTAVSSSGGSSSKSLLSGAEVRVSRGRSADRNV